MAAPGGVFDHVGNFVVRRPLVVIGLWVAIAAVLALALPPLFVQAGKREQKPLPDDAPTMVVQHEMEKAFTPPGAGGKKSALGGGGSLLLVVLVDEKGLSPADLGVYGKLVDKLHEDTQDKMSVQDFIAAPQARELLASKDGKAINMPISFPDAATSPTTNAAYHRVKEIAKQVTTGTTLSAYVSGPVATLVDATELAQEDADFIAIATVLGVLIILFVIYRNVVTMVLPLLNIGASLATSQGVLSALAELGLPINMQTLVLMTAVLIGAGTDYAVFLISRYHDYVKHGQDSDQAVKNALMSIGKVIAASAATVAVTFLAMIFTKLEVFSAVGPAISVSIVVALLSAVTLLPSLLVLAGRRGWIKPRRALTTRFWRVMGSRVVRKPRIHLVASLMVLITLASCTTLMQFNYDDLKTMPDDVDSSRGYEAMSRHFPMNMMTPMVLFIQSPRDLRAPSALADLEQVASRIAQVPNITLIRGLTRPTGDPLEQTKVSFQAGEVGNKLDEASSGIQGHGGDLDKLVNGANQLADALASVKQQVNTAVGQLSGTVAALTTLEALIGGDKTIATLEQAAALTGQMKSLGDSLNSSTTDAQSTAAWASPMLTALNSSPECNTDPGCQRSRAGLAALVQADNDGTLNSIKSLSRSMQATQGAQTVGQSLTKVQQALEQAVATMKAIKALPTTMNNLQRGTGALAMGSRAIAGGVKELVDQTKKIGTGLGDASSFLLAMKHDAQKPDMAGFNIPPQFMTNDQFKQGAALFIAPDGHAARYFIQSAINPFSTPAMDQINTIVDAAKSALPNTELANAKISVAGIPSGLRDTRDYYNGDIEFIIGATILIVFLILVALLRAIVAPLYLIASVLISYLSALGIGVLVFQLILGKNLHWSLPGLSFILLVAVGADYNMLLISRIRDESPHGVRVGVIRTVGTTGGVITSAGLIFAASMFGLMTASIYTMAEAGFIIGIGILIDTFLVRTITVPAVAAMVGQKNWWPSKLGQRDAVAGTRGRRAQIPDVLTRFKVIPSHQSHPATGVAPGTKSDAAATTNGESSVDYLSHHALPLFDLNGPVHRLTDDLRKSKVVPRTNSNGHGNKPTDRYLGHALPLFGPSVTSHRVIKLATNGNGHAKSNGHGNGNVNVNGNGNGHVNGHVNGNGHTDDNGKQPIDHYQHSLPLFGHDVLSPQPANGNGHAKSDDDDPDNANQEGDHEGNQETDDYLGQALPLFGH